jgi:hypothetical protein
VEAERANATELKGDRQDAKNAKVGGEEENALATDEHRWSPIKKVV